MARQGANRVPEERARSQGLHLVRTAVHWVLNRWIRHDELVKVRQQRGSVGREARIMARKVVGREIDRALWHVAGGSSKFWDLHYRIGGTSGPGSLGRMRSYKAEFVNIFVVERRVHEVIEFGCGNGDQLVEAKYPRYIGLDVSKSVLQQAVRRFADDLTKSFFVYDPAAYRDNAGVFKAELVLSLDVIFHLVEDAVYTKYIADLFKASTRWVIVYSSNKDEPVTNVRYTRHRRFTDDVERIGGWVLISVESNPFAADTASQFFVFEKACAGSD